MFSLTHTSTKAFFLGLIVVAGSIWKIFFDYGAYGEIFFDSIFTIVFISMAIYVGSWFIPKRERPFGMIGGVLFLFPLIWFFFTYAEILDPDSPFEVMVGILEWIVVLFSLPYCIFFILRITQEDVIIAQSKKMLMILIGIGIMVAGSAYLLGMYNRYFLYCRDFKIAGMETPRECFSLKDQKILRGEYE